MLEFNLLYGILLAIAIVFFIRVVLPYLKKIGYSDIYTDVKMGLLLFGYAFRDEKVKAIADIIYRIVGEMEKLDIAPSDKKDEAVDVALRALIKELDLEIEEDAIKTIINIAVAYLPPTHSDRE